MKERRTRSRSRILRPASRCPCRDRSWRGKYKATAKFAENHGIQFISPTFLGRIHEEVHLGILSLVVFYLCFCLLATDRGSAKEQPGSEGEAQPDRAGAHPPRTTVRRGGQEQRCGFLPTHAQRGLHRNCRQW